MENDNKYAYPYQEPSITTLLLYASFILLLNLKNALLNALISCGLLGQILIGVAFGTPGAQWLLPPAENIIVTFGYLGLVLVVYEGGVSTSFTALKANLCLSLAIAATGITVPIALSYALLGIVSGTTPLQAFTAGAALCSTSLGTAFTVLWTSGLTSTRLGIVLTSGAIIDDVAGKFTLFTTTVLESSADLDIQDWSWFKLSQILAHHHASVVLGLFAPSAFH